MKGLHECVYKYMQACCMRHPCTAEVCCVNQALLLLGFSAGHSGLAAGCGPLDGSPQ
jgi:hypothetical protein